MMETVIVAATIACMYNAYTDGQWWKAFQTNHKKYYWMVFYGLVGLGLLTMWRREPPEGHKWWHFAKGMAELLPVNRSTLQQFEPIFDLTQLPTTTTTTTSPNPHYIPSSTFIKHKRRVSETRKKFVAANQGWKCGHCKEQLDHTYEIDHRIRLEYGGTNEVDNLVALCRNCHGKKTALENM